MGIAYSSVTDTPSPPTAATVLERLRDIVTAVRVVSPTLFTFQQHRYDVDAMALPAAATPNPLLVLLTQTLYERCYCARLGAPNTVATGAMPTPQLTEHDAVAQLDFQRSLAAANTSYDAWELGWRVSRTMPDGHVLATKNDLSRTIAPGGYLTTGMPGAAPAVGGLLRIPMPRDSWTTQLGYYYAFGASLTDAQDDTDIVRLYWNVRADGSAPLLRTLTTTLNRYAIPFKYKCQIHPLAYERVDGTVLFISRRHFRITVEALVDVYDRVAIHLDDEVPLFTRFLRPGLSVAEDPGTGESFGMHRMAIVANGLWSAFTANAQRMDARLDAMRADRKSVV